MKQCLSCKEVMDLANHRRVAVTAGTKGIAPGWWSLLVCNGCEHCVHSHVVYSTLAVGTTLNSRKEFL
jgi:hypothetical protein